MDSSGNVTIDATNVQPISATANGQTLSIKYSGTGSGTMSTSNGQITFTPDSNSTLQTQTFGADGTPIGTPAPSRAGTQQYSCVHGQSLKITDQGISFDYVAGTGAGASASPTPT